MNAMVRFDLITMKNSLLQSFITIMLIAMVVTVVTESVKVGVGAVVMAIPFTYIFSVSAYDEMNGWERFRLTLPITRRQVVYGRYAGVLVVMAACSIIAALFAWMVIGIVGMMPSGTMPEGSFAEESAPEVVFAVIAAIAALLLITASITLPFVMKFGLTKGTRLLPVAMALLFVFGVWAVGESGFLHDVLDTWNQTEASITLIVATAVISALVLFILSALISVRLYEKREL